MSLTFALFNPAVASQVNKVHESHPEGSGPHLVAMATAGQKKPQTPVAENKPSGPKR